MTGQFSFSFAGDDIEDDGQSGAAPELAPSEVPSSTSTTTAAGAGASAFPVQGKPLLPPICHDIDDMISRLPSKIAYGLMSMDLDDGSTIQVPRRELWDVRVQLMAEEEENSSASETAPGLGEHDVKTGIYEGGFKSWESSVDLVKVLASENTAPIFSRSPCLSIELGCGTALPSLALFQWALAGRQSGARLPLVLALADYNPSVLYLVTVPNFILAWALQQRGENPVLDGAFSPDGEMELDLTSEVLQAFKDSLLSNQISLLFLSGAWSPEFVQLLSNSMPSPLADGAGEVYTLVMGAETIYSPFALESFATTLLAILEQERRSHPRGQSTAIIAAKRLYFGVGGSLDDFVDRMKTLGTNVETLREETQGVRRGVISCRLS
ncbi:hypothetical protein B0T16DRAFT_318922 [Cercophora newfieldiana]|uniref:protein-histidine N-methyltransferase n=1 Tax=Cercophora newfieldiana TaxID=92897 RepID=A0AA40D0F6_9PEZI|nr:hypothetical protein B0T16DRAFT_318922 [Cercophora newfieldiana]